MAWVLVPRNFVLALIPRRCSLASDWFIQRGGIHVHFCLGTVAIRCEEPSRVLRQYYTRAYAHLAQQTREMFYYCTDQKEPSTQLW